MATLEDAAGIAMSLAEVTEGKRYGKRALRETILDGWLCCAPPKLTAKYVKDQSASDG